MVVGRNKIAPLRVGRAEFVTIRVHLWWNRMVRNQKS